MGCVHCPNIQLDMSIILYNTFLWKAILFVEGKVVSLAGSAQLMQPVYARRVPDEPGTAMPVEEARRHGSVRPDR